MSAQTTKRAKQPTSKNQRIMLAAGALMLLLGAVGPWVTALGVISVGPTASVEASIVVFGGAALLVLMAVLGQAARRVSIIVGTLALIESGYAIVRIQQIKADADEWGALIQPGWGLYLTAIVGVALIVSTFVVKAEPAPEAVTA